MAKPANLETTIEPDAFEMTASRGFVDWLISQQVSLALYLRAQVLFALAMDYTSMERLTDALNTLQIAVATADTLSEKSETNGLVFRSLRSANTTSIAGQPCYY